MAKQKNQEQRQEPGEQGKFPLAVLEALMPEPSSNRSELTPSALPFVLPASPVEIQSAIRQLSQPSLFRLAA